MTVETQEYDDYDELRASRQFSPALIAVIALTVLWVLFFWRLLTPTAADRVIFENGDFPLHFYSYSSYQAERLWDGELPLWNPYNYGGDPFAANVQFESWYPPRLVAIALAGLAVQRRRRAV